ncbi:hypothetical protein KCP76_06045 [Salmonella enterica subsp. enterica serovar Weltevreden]|nr:hypothetical protein KCP76_06045 [Salmonella enterica subsp. enterica serovar Weltevreden]
MKRQQFILNAYAGSPVTAFAELQSVCAVAKVPSTGFCTATYVSTHAELFGGRARPVVGFRDDRELGFKRRLASQ